MNAVQNAASRANEHQRGNAVNQDDRTAGNSQVDGYLKKAGKWQAEMEKLRAIVLECGLTEELKWGKPCYTREGRNIVLMMGFKDHFILLFPSGALMKDSKNLLIRPSENTQAARQLRLTSAAQVDKLKTTLKAYVREAIAVEKAGLKVEFKKPSEFEVPEELQARLDETPTLKKAFDKLTPGRQRAYMLHIASAKQSKTRSSRVEKCVPQILAGKGLDD
jgi:uncharacterized protein YdeI (YjbR/CyaY-like superfamily)